MDNPKVARSGHRSRTSDRSDVEALQQAVIRKKVALVNLFDNRTACMLVSQTGEPLRWKFAKALDALIAAEDRLNEAHAASRVAS